MEYRVKSGNLSLTRGQVSALAETCFNDNSENVLALGIVFAPPTRLGDKVEIRRNIRFGGMAASLPGKWRLNHLLGAEWTQTRRISALIRSWMAYLRRAPS